MIDRDLMRYIQILGGFAEIGKDSNVTDWQALLQIADLPERKIKTGAFRYVDVFGHYSDRPLQAILGRKSSSIYAIGSHDSGSITGS